MEPITMKMAKALNSTTKLWTIELTDLGVHQAFMGYSLSDKYLMIGITSPMFEDQISINSIPKTGVEELKVPIHLEKCDCGLFGSINFKGLEKFITTWELFFYDSRFDEETQIIEGNLIPIKQLTMNTRREHLKLIGYSKETNKSKSLFELRLRPRK